MNSEKIKENQKRKEIEGFVTLLDSNNEMRRIYAIDSLQKDGSKRAIRILIKCLKHDVPLIRNKATISLGRLGAKEAVFQLNKRLKDRDLAVKNFTSEALGKIGDYRSIMPLFRTMNHEDELVKDMAINALGKIRAKLLEKGINFTPKQPIHFTLEHIDPAQHPKSFQKFLKEIRKGKNKTRGYWKLTAKQLMAMEGRLK